MAIGLVAGVPGGAAAGLLVIAHVVHDLRPEAEALADRDAAAELAHQLGLSFAEARISCRGQGNAEAAARRLRYQALGEIARQHGCGFVATAHHAGDQLETILMGILRGSGPAGLAGVARRRALGEVRVIRPCLDLPRSDLLRLCREAGWQWREDLTNVDTTRLRAALRHEVIPQLQRLRPGVERRTARAAHLLTDTAGLIEDVARELRGKTMLEQTDAGLRFSREGLRQQREVVVGALLRRAAIDLRGEQGQDQLGRAALEPVIRAIGDARIEPRRFEWPGLAITVRARDVEMRRLM